MISLLGGDPQWTELLRQEGVSFRTHWTDSDSRDCQILMIDRAPERNEHAAIRRFVDSGHGLLASSSHAAEVWPELRIRRVRLQHILPCRSFIFRNVGVVYLGLEGRVARNANCGLTNTNDPAVYAGRHGNGWCVLLPFDVGNALRKTATVPRIFHARARRPVFEVVSAVSRGEVRRLVANSLRFLLGHQGHPYIHLSYVPPGGEGMFGFRLDTDFDSEKHLAAAAGLSRTTRVPFTWFLNVGAHERRLAGVVNLLSGQDIQLHCLRHKVYGNFKDNLDNLTKAKRLLAEAGIEPCGLAGPYGDWNLSWQRASAALGIQYSSEFALAYDDLPFMPVSRAYSGLEVLQIPVHPVCPGLLLAARADGVELVDYYQRHIVKQSIRREPCFIYGHPANVLRVRGVVEQVLGRGREICGLTGTMTEYARWWLARRALVYRAEYANGRLLVETQASSPAHRLVVEGNSEWSEAAVRSDRVALGALPRAEVETVRAGRTELAAARSGRFPVHARNCLRRLRRRHD